MGSRLTQKFWLDLCVAHRSIVCINSDRRIEMLVSELAKKLSITPDTVRFYTRVNLLQPKIDSANGYKRYDNDDLHRLKFILAARNLGFSVDDIRQILDRTDHNHSAEPCAHYVQLQSCKSRQRLLCWPNAVRQR